ncbi:MAG: hypothetical protein QM656_05525 [Paracoccaceae bacterium]
MLVRVISAAVLAVLAGGAFAQTASDFGGPKELPPADFTGQQYVDSMGCVFLRTGYGGNVGWAPRVTAERKPLCGQQPSFAPKAVAQPAGAPVVAATVPPKAKKPVKVRHVDPKSYVPAKPAKVAARPQVAPMQVPEYRVVPSVPGRTRIACYRSAPVPVLVRLRDGSLTVMCTPGDGSRTGWRTPGRAPVQATAVTAKAVPAAAAPGAGDPWLYDPPMFGGTGYAVALRQSGNGFIR